MRSVANHLSIKTIAIGIWIAILPPTVFADATDVSIDQPTIQASIGDWSVLSSGGSQMNLGALRLGVTLGQTAAGRFSLGEPNLTAGFWQDFDNYPICCGVHTNGYTGNINCGVDGKRNIADVTRLIDRVYLSKTILCCEENGNTDGDVEGKMNIADITRLIDNIWLSKQETAACK